MRLAATGSASALPNFGSGGRPVDRTLDAVTCQVPSEPGPNPGDKGLPLTSKGKFDNVLLGQVIALSLNIRLDPNLGQLQLSSLGSQVMLKGKKYRRFYTQGVNPDGSLISGDLKAFMIPQTVIDALADPSLAGPDNVGKVAGLQVLANRALAGLPVGSASLADINAGVDAINAGFDKCRVIVSGPI